MPVPSLRRLLLSRMPRAWIVPSGKPLAQSNVGGYPEVGEGGRDHVLLYSCGAPV